MVYLNLLSLNFQSSKKFYCDTLKLFKAQSNDRLICLAADLILDLDEHCCKSDFSIHIGEHRMAILKELGCAEIVHKLESNIAGDFLQLIDPSGNNFTVFTHGGNIK